MGLGLYRLLNMEGLLGSSKDADFNFFIHESINLTEQSMAYRPLGSSSVLLCLALSYALATDEALLQRITDLLAVWEIDHESIEWLDLAASARSRVHERGWLYVTSGQF